MVEKRQRQQRIREILARNEIRSQEQLQELLLAENISTTQATLSRDLRDLGAVRSTRGYLLDKGGSTGDAKQLRRALQEGLRSAGRGGTLIVLRTEPGHAQALAHEIERAELRQVLGAIAGHDTVFVATQSSGGAGELLRLFDRLRR